MNSEGKELTHSHTVTKTGFKCRSVTLATQPTLQLPNKRKGFVQGGSTIQRESGQTTGKGEPHRAFKGTDTVQPRTHGAADLEGHFFNL
jgi:hypothetical protein